MTKKDNEAEATEIAVSTPSNVAVTDNSFTINPSQEDMMIPYLKVVQQLSDEVVKGKDKYNESVSAGDVYDGVTRTVYTKSNIIICGIKKYYAEWTPEIRGSLIAKHSINSPVVLNAVKEENTSDKGAKYFKLKTNTGNDLVETYGVVCIVKKDDITIPAVFTLSKSAFMAGKSLNTLLVMHQSNGLPMFTFDTSVTSNSKGSWYKPVFSFSGYEKDSSVIDMAKSLSTIVDKLLFTIRADEMDVEGTTVDVDTNELPV